MMLPMPDNTRNDLSKHIGEGIFVVKRVTFWRGRPVFIFGKDQKIIFKPSKVFSKHDMETESIRFCIRRLFFFYAFKTKYGYFVPNKNIEVFWSNVEDLKKRHKLLCESICDNYDTVIKELKRRASEIAHFKWTNDLRHPGKPTEAFLESFSDSYLKLHTKSYIIKRFKFDVFPVNPIISEVNSVYGTPEFIRISNSKVEDDLYKAIIVSRCIVLKTMFKYKGKIKKGLKPYKGIANFCQLYRNSLFYKDDSLLEKMNSLRAESMNGLSRDSEKIIMMIDSVIEDIIKNDSYLTGMIYDTKV